MTGRKFFSLFSVCAALPLVAAYISLAMGWFTHTGLNKGEWLQHEIQLLPDEIASPKINKLESQVHWHLVYVQAAACDQQCEEALYTLQQLFVGLGRKQLAIRPLVIAQQPPAQLPNFPSIKWQPGNNTSDELQHHIVIVNQRGMVLLRYPVDGNPDHLRDLAKNIRTDLLRLINYDRSGA